jgi:hypothetical protein
MKIYLNKQWIYGNLFFISLLVILFGLGLNRVLILPALDIFITKICSFYLP